MSIFHLLFFFSLPSSLAQDDEKFLTDLFAQLTDEATDDDKRYELVRQLTSAQTQLMPDSHYGPDQTRSHYQAGRAWLGLVL